MVKLSYYTQEQLIRESGLSRPDFNRLVELRLLRLRKDNQYRHKQLTWCTKLRQLIDQGWEVEVIKVWASNRSKEDDPNVWPPDYDYWKSRFEQSEGQ